jgi:D-alanyl-D-alanine carboxypeptidase
MRHQKLREHRFRGRPTKGVCLAGFLAVAVCFVLLAGDASARRHYYRYSHRSSYSPPASAMAIDLYSGRILYSKNANEPRYPASITKVMTLYLLFDALRDGKITMNTKIRVSEHAADQSPTKLGLSEGDTITVADAIGAIVTKSANDMAVAVAEALAGSEDEFARRMTQKARTIGMLNTTFRNASGLPNDEQKTTAQDLIILGKNILADHPERCKVFSTRYFQYDGEVYRNHNTMLFTYEGMEGMKTGFTSAAGFNLIATARRGDKRLLAVVLGGASAGARNSAMRGILDSSWSKAMTQTAAKKAGILTAAIKPKPEPVSPPAPKPAAHEQTRKAVAEAAPHRSSVPDSSKAESAPATVPGPFSRLKRRPDRTSMSMLIGSIEASVMNARRSPASGEAQIAADMATDEPDDKAERAATRSAAYAPPKPQEIQRNETLVALTAAPQTVNMSVHYKTVHQPEVEPLEAAALEPAPSGPTAQKPVQLASRETPQSPMHLAAATETPPPPGKTPEPAPQTLAAATVQESQSLNQPGPYHIQVGAFADRDQAKERLENVKEALGAAMLKHHPEFIMPVSMPSGGTMFRARLSRFADEGEAKAACKRLKRSGIECWDIRAQ